MAYIKEELNIADIPITLQVLEKHGEPFWEPWAIIDLEFDNFEKLTPEQLIRLGNFFVEQGERIRKTYTSTGKKRKNIA